VFEKFLEQIVTSKSKTLLAFCFCFLLGVAIASVTIEYQVDFIYLYSAVVIFVPLLILFWGNEYDRFLIIAVFLLFLGFFHFSYGFPSGNHIYKFNSKEVNLTGVVADEPDVRIGKVQYILDTNQVNNRPVSGKVLVSNNLYPRYNYGDKLKINCKLKQPEPFNDFRYDMYLANFDIFSICRYAEIKKVGEGKGNFVMSHILSFKREVANKVNKLWHEPYASFMAGLLYGYRGGMGELDELFNKAGITHIVAISGFHITIVSAILMGLCIHFYISRQKAFWVVVLGILVYIIFTGMPASVLRAGTMGGLVLLARKMGRASNIENTLAVTAVVMTIANPFVLIWNGAFQLSFMATIGLVYLTPMLEDYFDFIPNILELRESLVATLAAIVMTLPLVLYLFGRISLIAPITNILVIGLVPWVIILGFITLIVSFISMPVAQIFSWIARFGLEYITKVIKFLTDFSFASVKFTLPLWIMLMIYIVLLSWIYRQKDSLETN